MGGFFLSPAKMYNYHVKKFYLKTTLFWGVLLVIAILNAVIREATYKPFLEPYIGMWAHQISSFTAIAAFFVAIYVFVKKLEPVPSERNLIIASFIWVAMTVIFETSMNILIRKLTLEQTLQTYYFWRGETWILVLLSLILSPLIALKVINKSQLIGHHPSNRQ